MARRNRRVPGRSERNRCVDSSDVGPRRGRGLKSALDTNVIVYLVGNEPSSAMAAREILKEARRSGALVICGVVYSELLAHPKMTPLALAQFLSETGIDAEFDTGRDIWHEAGLRYSRYSTRRSKSKAGSPRR